MFNRAIQALVRTTCIFSICTFSVQADNDSSEFEDPFYVGLGLGLSFLEPETNSVALTLTEDSDAAYKLLVGYRFNENWSIEGFWANLGEAEVTATTGTKYNIEYKTFGVNGLYNYPLNDRWSIFARLGAGRLENNVQGVNVERVEDYFIAAGGGVTWNMTGTWDLRAEYEYLDTDAQLLSLNVIKRFGSATTRRINKLESRLEEQDQQLQAAMVTTAAAASVATARQSSCDDSSVELHGVFFPASSIELNQASRQALDAVAEKMKALPEDIEFEVRAHTDSRGTELYNYTLSLSRARNVRDYLASKGIAIGRIHAAGYGEWRPRDTNDTEEGRYRNRRAELVLLGVEKYVDDISTCADNISSVIED